MQSLDVLSPSRPMDCRAIVLQSVALTPTIKSIRLRLDQPEFRFLPGQSIWPRFQRDGKTFSKIYSISSSPHTCPEIELCVSRVGWSSAYLQDLQVGEAIAARGPYGLMTLGRLPNRPRLYIAEGSGIAPLKSQIDWLYDCRFSHPVWLVQSNPETPDQLPYCDYWRSLQAVWPQFQYVEAIDCGPERWLMQRRLDLDRFDVEICGVGKRVAQLQDIVLGLGAIAEQVRSETFYAF
ncbi:MAG TPA: FAD-dependent oxidoreductase [Crinalium sp.]